MVAGDRRWRAAGAGRARGRALGRPSADVSAAGSRAAKLLPLGIAISDYFDGLFDEGVEVIAAETMLRHLAECDDWQRCELHPLRGDTPLVEARKPAGCADES
jgi:hypothetical protein